MMKPIGLMFSLLIMNMSGFGQSNNHEYSDNNLTTLYENPVYDFEVRVPKEWEIYGEVINDSIRAYSIIDWGLPKIYSEVEKTEIENSVSIRAYINESNKSIQDVIKSEYLRIDPTNTSMEIEEGIDENARIIYYDGSDGKKYKGKSYFKWKNGISYILTFMATPGTYELNLSKFEKLYTTFIIK